jgi:hypothetical protein
MTLDMHISIGELVVAGSFIISVVGVYARLSERLAVLETKVDDMWHGRTRRRHDDEE